MLSKFHKYLKKIGLSFIGGVFALALGLLLLVPEAQSGETGARKYTRESGETGARKYTRESGETGAKKYNTRESGETDTGRKKMNRTNRSVDYVPRYDVQRMNYGPTDIPSRRPRRPDYVVTDGETNYVVHRRGALVGNGETNKAVLLKQGERQIAQGEKEGRVLIKGSERDSDQPTGVHRIGRKGKEKERQRQALLAEQNAAESFGKGREKDTPRKQLGKEGKGGDSMGASETSTNGIKTLMWQTAAPPSGSVHTARSPRRAGSLERRGDIQRNRDVNNSARKIKERNRERQGESKTNVVRRTHSKESADDKADSSN